MQKVKGTRDFYGLDLLQRNYIISLLRDTYEKYNFEQLETPAFEYISYFFIEKCVWQRK